VVRLTGGLRSRQRRPRVRLLGSLDSYEERTKHTTDVSLQFVEVITVV
jgi:hypothetical protein